MNMSDIITTFLNKDDCAAIIIFMDVKKISIRKTKFTHNRVFICIHNLKKFNRTGKLNSNSYSLIHDDNKKFKVQVENILASLYPYSEIHMPETLYIETTKINNKFYADPKKRREYYYERSKNTLKDIFEKELIS